ncbi:FecR family protein [Glacieibacterium sp.]|uniref:FecR family protein n=1 Tax=Glacieibacterium sp. TaxID=2860237 RepID=UPI003B008147
MENGPADIVDQAIAWHLRLGKATAADWRSFTLWLENAAHRDAYDRVTLDDAMLAPVLQLHETPASELAANDRLPARRRFRLAAAGGGALAAGLLVALMMPAELPTADDGLYSVETPTGTRRKVTLRDGTIIELNGGTRVTLDRANGRYAMLDRGEASFQVHHNAAQPFEVRSGGSTISDVGTVFNVAREGPQLNVEVAEGAVAFERTGAPGDGTMLKPGMALAIRDDERQEEARLSNLPPATVGGWRRGLLTYREAPLAQVARALERSTGAKLQLAGALAERQFTGTIQLAGGAEAVIPRMAALVDARFERRNGAWLLSSRSDVGE